MRNYNIKHDFEEELYEWISQRIWNVFWPRRRRLNPRALAEIRAGRKSSHWMWYIFPQLRGLGRSSDAWLYGIEDLEEARAYLAHSVLGKRLREITQALLACRETDPVRIFGHTDSMKLRSSMTLFAEAGQEPLFQEVLDRFYRGQSDRLTLRLLSQKGTQP